MTTRNPLVQSGGNTVELPTGDVLPIRSVPAGTDPLELPRSDELGSAASSDLEQIRPHLFTLSVTGAAALTSASHGRLIVCSGTAPYTITLPTDALCPEGYTCTLINTTTGALTLAAAAGASLFGHAIIPKGFGTLVVRTGTNAFRTVSLQAVPSATEQCVTAKGDWVSPVQTAYKRSPEVVSNAGVTSAVQFGAKQFAAGELTVGTLLEYKSNVSKANATTAISWWVRMGATGTTSDTAIDTGTFDTLQQRPINGSLIVTSDTELVLIESNTIDTGSASALARFTVPSLAANALWLSAFFQTAGSVEIRSAGFYIRKS